MMNLIQVHTVGTWFNSNQSFCSRVHLCPLRLQNRSSRENSLFRDNQPAASAPNVVSQSAEDVGVQRIATPTTLSPTASIGREVRKRSNIFYPLSVHDRPCSWMFSGCVVSLREYWVILCHAGSGQVGRMWLAREKSLEIFWLGQEWNGSI